MDVADRNESPVREHWDEGAYDDDLDQNGTDKPSKHRSKDRRKSSGQGEDADHRSKDRKDLEKDRRERRKEDRDERDKERSKDRDKYREKDKDRKEKRREQEKERETEKERGKEKSFREKEGDRVKEKEREREKGREKHKDHREKEREGEKDRDREKTREKGRDKEREMDLDKDKDRSRERDRASKKAREEDYYRSKNDKLKSDYEDSRDRDVTKQMKVSYDDKDERNAEDASGRASAPASAASELENRILRMKEERLKKKSEGVSEVLSWVSKSRKLEEEKNAEKEKALQLSKIFEEQDNIVLGESEDEEDGQHNKHDLSGIKVLHGLDKVMDGGAVVLTLKDQNILADGDINDDIDMLENIEIGEQKRRDEAYKAAKKKTGIYDDKFGDDPSSEKKMLPQYDDPAAEEGVTLDARGRFTGEAEKKLEELRRRLQGTSTTNQFEDLSSSAKISSDFYTHEEMLKFKKPKKKKSLRKKEKLDLDALEAEAVSSGLGLADRGSRNDGRRQAIREEQERIDAEMRNNAYQSAYAKADEATKALRLEQTLPVKMEEDENPVIADDDEDLYKSLGRARKLAFKKQEEAASGPKAIALLAAAATSRSQTADDQNPTNGEPQENKVVFTEIEEFAWGLQLVEEAHKPDNEDVFMDEDEAPVTSEQEIKDETGGWTEVKDTEADENPDTEDKEEIVPDETIHEIAVGKGLSGALKLLKDRGTLKESIEWGGRNMDKKKSKLVGIVDDKADKADKTDKADKADNDNRFNDLRIERMDEFGRIMTPKEAFRMISHKFHGKGPGKMKQEKRMKQYHEELKLKQMKNSDTPSESVERMREAQSRLKTPYLVLSGHVKPGQTSDPRSGFATVEKDLPGGLTPMLGNSKVEHFLGIKRKAEPGNSSMPKKPKS